MSAPQTDTARPQRTLRELRQNGPAIRSLREKDGWRQGAFAKEVGMSQAALSNIERERRPTTMVMLNRIARALCVPVTAITRDYEGAPEIEPEGAAA